jgi:hypothetical protein
MLASELNGVAELSPCAWAWSQDASLYVGEEEGEDVSGSGHGYFTGPRWPNMNEPFSFSIIPFGNMCTMYSSAVSFCTEMVS